MMGHPLPTTTPQMTAPESKSLEIDVLFSEGNAKAPAF